MGDLREHLGPGESLANVTLQLEGGIQLGLLVDGESAKATVGKLRLLVAMAEHYQVLSAEQMPHLPASGPLPPAAGGALPDAGFGPPPRREGGIFGVGGKVYRETFNGLVEFVPIDMDGPLPGFPKEVLDAFFAGKGGDLVDECPTTPPMAAQAEGPEDPAKRSDLPRRQVATPPEAGREGEKIAAGTAGKVVTCARHGIEKKLVIKTEKGVQKRKWRCAKCAAEYSAKYFAERKAKQPIATNAATSPVPTVAPLAARRRGRPRKNGVKSAVDDDGSNSGDDAQAKTGAADVDLISLCVGLHPDGDEHVDPISEIEAMEAETAEAVRAGVITDEIAVQFRLHPCTWPGCVGGSIKRADGTWKLCNSCEGTGFYGTKAAKLRAAEAARQIAGNGRESALAGM